MSNLELKALEIWDRVCRDISLILKECNLYGLVGILTIPDPSIESRIIALRSLDMICQSIIDGIDNSSIDWYSIIRVMINAKQQILHLEMLLNAAKRNDQIEFKRSLSFLSAQSVV